MAVGSGPKSNQNLLYISEDVAVSHFVKVVETVNSSL